MSVNPLQYTIETPMTVIHYNFIHIRRTRRSQFYIVIKLLNTFVFHKCDAVYAADTTTINETADLGLPSFVQTKVLAQSGQKEFLCHLSSMCRTVCLDLNRHSPSLALPLNILSYFTKYNFANVFGIARRCGGTSVRTKPDVPSCRKSIF